jgi:hypothetical protein
LQGASPHHLIIILAGEIMIKQHEKLVTAPWIPEMKAVELTGKNSTQEGNR